MFFTSRRSSVDEAIGWELLKAAPARLSITSTTDGLCQSDAGDLYFFTFFSSKILGLGGDSGRSCFESLSVSLCAAGICRGLQVASAYILLLTLAVMSCNQLALVVAVNREPMSYRPPSTHVFRYNLDIFRCIVTHLYTHTCIYVQVYGSSNHLRHFCLISWVYSSLSSLANQLEIWCRESRTAAVRATWPMVGSRERLVARQFCWRHRTGLQSYWMRRSPVWLCWSGSTHVQPADVNAFCLYGGIPDHFTIFHRNLAVRCEWLFVTSYLDVV